MDSRLWAENYASSLLAGNPLRWDHSCAVASLASSLAELLVDDPEERSILVAAAWLRRGMADAPERVPANRVSASLDALVVR